MSLSDKIGEIKQVVASIRSSVDTMGQNAPEQRSPKPALSKSAVQQEEYGKRVTKIIEGERQLLQLRESLSAIETEYSRRLGRSKFGDKSDAGESAQQRQMQILKLKSENAALRRRAEALETEYIIALKSLGQLSKSAAEQLRAFSQSEEAFSVFGSACK